MVRSGISLYSVAIDCAPLATVVSGARRPPEPGMVRVAGPSLMALAIWASRQFPYILPPVRKMWFDKKESTKIS